MRFCINPITFGESVTFPASVQAAAAGGFDAFELWLPSVEAYLAEGHSPADARAVLDGHGVRAVGACFVQGLIDSQGEPKVEAFDAAKRRFELCEALGAPTICCVGDGPPQPGVEDYDHAAERLREIGDLAASFGLTIGLEFVAGFPFLGTLDSALRVVRKAEHGHVGVLLDLFHFYVGRSKMADLDGLTPPDIAFVHFNDAQDLPREVLTDAERVFPGEGCFPIDDILARLEAGGFRGYCSIELFSPDLSAKPPGDVARAAKAVCDGYAAGRDA